MIKVENIETFNFEGAIRGMRNPMNSWDKSDSYRNYCVEYDESGEEIHHPYYRVGAHDLDLMHRLYVAGSEHRKYLRQIFVSMDIIAPRYWWAEMNTYKVGTTSNSCSTMHKIHAKELVLDDFSHEHLNEDSLEALKCVINMMNGYRHDYVDKDNKSKSDWWQMIQLLPSSYNQRRTITMTYENVVSIIKQRRAHKLDEWRDFCNILLDLPYIRDIIGEETVL